MRVRFFQIEIIFLKLHVTDLCSTSHRLDINSLVVCEIAVVTTFVKIGPDIDGEAAEDQFGYSVSMSADGRTFIVGAKFGNGTSDAGYARVYKYDTNTESYTKIGQDIVGEAARDTSGHSVCISADGTTFAVGAPQNRGSSSSDTGHVRVYKYDPIAEIYIKNGQDIDGEAAFDYSSWSVSLSADGTTVIVGAPFNDGIGKTAGHVRVYKYDPATKRHLKIGSDIDGEAVEDQFGSSVSISADGTIFVVGAPWNDGNGKDSGHVRVYQYNSITKNYVKIGQDVDGEGASRFGASVSISADGKTFAAGANLNNGNAGIVRVYKFDATTQRHMKVGQDLNGEAVGDNSGFSVGLSADGTTVAVGANFNDGNGRSAGHVRVYQYDTAVKGYIKIGPDIDGEAIDDQFGFSVSISGDGKTFVVGAPFNDGNGVSAGHVRVYKTMTTTLPPTIYPTKQPSTTQTNAPTKLPTILPTRVPTNVPTTMTTKLPTNNPTNLPSKSPTKPPTDAPTKMPTKLPTKVPTKVPSKSPTKLPTRALTAVPTKMPTKLPTSVPLNVPFHMLSKSPTSPATNVPASTPKPATIIPTDRPSHLPSFHPAPAPVKTIPVSVPLSLPFATTAPIVVPISPVTDAPTRVPIPEPILPIPVPVKVSVPTKKPSAASPTFTTPVSDTPNHCGLFGLNFFCPRRGKCGFFRRLWTVNGCKRGY